MSLIEASGDAHMTRSAKPLRYALRHLAPTTVPADLTGAAGGQSALLAVTVAMQPRPRPNPPTGSEQGTAHP